MIDEDEMMMKSIFFAFKKIHFSIDGSFEEFAFVSIAPVHILPRFFHDDKMTASFTPFTSRAS